MLTKPVWEYPFQFRDTRKETQLLTNVDSQQWTLSKAESYAKYCKWFSAGHDTKAMMNNSGPRYKRSKVERDLNLDVIACVVILFTLCFLGGVGELWCHNILLTNPASLVSYSRNSGVLLFHPTNGVKWKCLTMSTVGGYVSWFIYLEW